MGPSPRDALRVRCERAKPEVLATTLGAKHERLGDQVESTPTYLASAKHTGGFGLDARTKQIGIALTIAMMVVLGAVIFAITDMQAAATSSSSSRTTSGLTTSSAASTSSITASSSSSPTTTTRSVSTTKSLTSTNSTSTSATSNPAQSPSFYVATDGNDAWSGTAPAASIAGNEGPFATLPRAQAAVRALRSAEPGRQVPVVVQLEGGTYFLNSTFSLGPADSGTVASPTVYKAAPNATVVISGGKLITGWSQVAPNQWTASAAGLHYFEQLWVNGNRIYRPDTTQGRYLYFVGPVYSKYRSANCLVQVGTMYECFNRFQFKSGDLSSSYYDINSVEIDDFECWTMPKLRLSSIDSSNNTAFLTGPTNEVQACHGFIAGHRYLVENVKESLSLPGQWYLDWPNLKITYISAQGENPNIETFIAPQLTQLVVGTGVSRVTFEGLTFSNANWVVPAKGWPSPQGEELSSNNVLPSALDFANSSFINVDSSTISRIGDYALSFTGTQPFNPSQSSQYDDQVTNDRIFDAGGGGIVIGRVPGPSDADAKVAQYTLIQNDEITGVGRFLPGAYGIYVLNSHNNVVSHNTISDVYSNGISVGGTYEYNIRLPQLAHDNLVEFNLVFNVNQGVAEDGGAIYTASGTAQGNRILNNVVHDVTAYLNATTHGYGGWGIYFDSTSQNVYAADNLVYRTSFPSIHQNDGFNNTVTNNILAFGNLGVIDRSHNNGSSLIVAHNIMLWDINSAQGSLLRGIWTCTGSCASQFLFSNNLYWYLNGTPNFITTNGNNPKPLSHTLAQWQSLGEDQGSIVADPMFADPNYPADNFTLASSSPALGIGFVPFDPGLAGILPGSLVPNLITGPAFPLQLFNPSTGF